MPDRLSDLLRGSALPKNHFLYQPGQPGMAKSVIRDDDGNVIYDQRSADEYARLAGIDGMGMIDPVTHDIAPLTPPGMFIGMLGKMGEEISKDPLSLRSYGNAARVFKEMGGADATPHLASTGIFAPKSAAVPGQTSRELKAMAEATLPEKVLEKAHAIASGNPEIKAALPFMLPNEVRTLTTGDSAMKTMRLLRALPGANEIASLARAGEAKKGWYRASTKGLIDIFGEKDAPRFAALLAATSPKNSVETNLLNSLNIWKNWTAAGRPLDPARIKQIMGKSVQGTKGEDSVLDAWVNNTNTALTAPDMANASLSGLKVNSFFRNLSGDPYAVTNDAWMSNGLGINQRHFASPVGYGATSARIRHGSQKANMLPLEGQETAWSALMPWLEGSESAGIHPREFLDRGLLTPELVRGTPDFSTLFKDPRYRGILDESGYGEALSKLKSYKWGPLTAPDLSIADQRNLDKFGGVLGELLNVRGREKASHMVPGADVRPEKVLASMTGEAIPYVHADHLSSLVNAPWSDRSAFTSKAATALEDIQGHNALQRSVGLPTMEQRTGTGLYSPPNAPRESQPLIVSPTMVPVTKRNVKNPENTELPAAPDLMPADKDKLQAVAALQGSMLVQGGTPYNAGIRWEKGPGIFAPAEKRVPESQMLSAGYLQDKLGRGDLAITDSGTSGVHVFPYDSTNPKAVTQEEGNKLSSLLAPQDALRPGGPPVPDFYRTQPVSGYAGYEGLWEKPNEGQVVRKMFTDVDKLAAPDYNRLDAAVRDPAGRISDLFTKTAASRKDVARDDVMNMLQILRTGGLKALRVALDEGQVALPAVGVLASLLSDTGDSQRQAQ